jgi:hypothetical protein
MPSETKSNDSAYPAYGDGLTKREYFAAIAMQGLCAGTNSHFAPEMYAEYSVKYADALINALND